MVGVSTLVEALKRSTNTVQATIRTGTLAGGQTHDFVLREEDSTVENLSILPPDAEQLNEGKIILLRPIVASGSTDTDLYIHESDERSDIDEVLRVEGLSTNDKVQTFQPGNADGAQYENQEDESNIYFRIEENSATDSEYLIRIRWINTD